MPSPDLNAVVVRVEQMAEDAAIGTVLDANDVADLRLLLTALRETREDGERLDWLERDHNALVYPSRDFGDFGVRVVHQDGIGFALSGKAREAIDAARAEAPDAAS